MSPEQLDVLRALQQHASAGEAEHPGVVNTQHGCMLTSIASMTLVRVNNPPQQDRDVRSPHSRWIREAFTPCRASTSERSKGGDTAVRKA
jgi:hypothetical protein